MWKFKSVKDLVSVLGECYGFPFCITSQKADYILCFDEHDCLIGSGKVKDLLQDLKKRLHQLKYCCEIFSVFYILYYLNCYAFKLCIFQFQK